MNVKFLLKFVISLSEYDGLASRISHRSTEFFDFFELSDFFELLMVVYGTQTIEKHLAIIQKIQKTMGNDLL